MPGPTAWYIARIERASVRAGHAIWPRKVPVEGAPYESLSGELNGLMILSKNKTGEFTLSPAGVWWVYKRYAEITGVLVETTASENNTVDAVAGLDSASRKARILLGAHVARDHQAQEGGTKGHGPDKVGTVAVTVRGLEAAPYLVHNGTVRATIETIPYHDGRPVESPEEAWEETVEIRDGEITLEFDWANPSDAYTITLE